MYEIVIDSKLFEGKRLIQQHRLVNEVMLAPDLLFSDAVSYITVSPLQALGDEVKSLHGMTIRIGNPRKDP